MRPKKEKAMLIKVKFVKSGEEAMTHVRILPAQGSLVIHAGKRHLTIKADNLDPYGGERGRRGRKLPRGFRNVDRFEVVHPQQMPLL